MEGPVQGDLHFIVDRLNEPPFSMMITMVGFDEKSPFELLEVVNEVMSQLSEAHKVDLRDETPEATATRMLKFLSVLNYPQPHNLDPQHAKQMLLHGEPSMIYSILTWMLQRMPELQKRAYLARFLVDVEVPDHMYSDPEIAEVYQNFKELQEEFKEMHKTSEKYKSQLISPTEIKKAIMQMEEDKGMLAQKVDGLKERLENVNRFEDMLAATHKLRLQQDEQVKLQDRLKEQKAQLLQAEHRLNSMVTRLNEKGNQRASSSGDVNAVLESLEREVQELDKQVLEVLPQQIHMKQRRAEELQQVLSEGATSDVDLNALQQQHSVLQRQVQQLEGKKREKDRGNPDDKLAMYKQQANLVAKKKDALLQRLSTVQRERDAIEAELHSKGKDLKPMPPMPGQDKDFDFRKYANDLRTKTSKYKRMKAELSELRNEWTVLSRTSALLRAQDQELGAKLGELEGKRGVTGYAQTQDDLEMVSKQKAEVDEMKGKTLDEMAQVVGEINEQIKRRKNQLAPSIVKLRKLRAEVREKEGSYMEKKGAFDAKKAGIESDLANVQADADRAIKEASHEESAACYYESAASIERVKLQRAQDERASRFQREMPDGSLVRSYKELYQNKLRQQEAMAKELRERQKHIKENHGGNAKQFKMFKDLHKMLRCKMDAQKLARAEANDMMNAEKDDTNIFTMPEGDGADYAQLN